MSNLIKFFCLVFLLVSISGCSLSSEKAATITYSPQIIQSQPSQPVSREKDLSPTDLPINPNSADQELLDILDDLNSIDLDSEFILLDEQLN